MRGALRVLLSLALAAAAAGYLTAEKRVTLADEGRVEVATTYASSVGGALDRLGVTLLPGDVVVPASSSTVANRIEIRRVKNVVVIVNGQARAAKVTAPTVGEALDELAVDLQGARIDPGPTSVLAEGDQLSVVQPVQVQVVADGSARSVDTNAVTAGGLLRQLGVTVGPYDRVEPSIVAYPAAGLVIKVIRVNEAIETKLVPIPFRRTSQKTDKLEFGIRKLGTTGVEGARARVYRVTYEDGRITKRGLIRTEVARVPVDEVVLIGTHRPVFVSHGGLQSGKATWYAAPGLTAAHRSLPFGTVVRVTNLANGRHVDVVIRDRGPWGDGRIIDVSDIAFRELSSLSTGVLNVKIEW